MKSAAGVQVDNAVSGARGSTKCSVTYNWTGNEFEECGTDCGLEIETKVRTVMCYGFRWK
eukprot:UN04449